MSVSAPNFTFGQKLEGKKPDEIGAVFDEFCGKDIEYHLAEWWS